MSIKKNDDDKIGNSIPEIKNSNKMAPSTLKQTGFITSMKRRSF